MSDDKLRKAQAEVSSLSAKIKKLEEFCDELAEDKRQYGVALTFFGRCVGTEADQEATRNRFPELFRTVMEQAADEHLAEILDAIEADG